MAKETKQQDQKNTAVSAYDWSQSGATGFENVQRSDLGTPFLSIVQKGSPQYDKTSKEYAAKKIEGIGVGDIFDTLSKKILYKEGGEPIQFIPCYWEQLYNEWTPREKGGGMVKVHRNASILNETIRGGRNGKQDVLRNGNIIVTTAYFFGLALVDGERMPSIIGLTSTQLKKSRLWLNQMMSLKVDTAKGKITPPMFSHIYKISSVVETNNDGSWYGWKIELGPMQSDPNIIAECITAAKSPATQRFAQLPPPSDSSSDSPIEADEVPFA